MHDPYACAICVAFEWAIPLGKLGITEREAAQVIGGAGVLEASKLLQVHGWRELPHPISEREDDARFAWPEEK